MTRTIPTILLTLLLALVGAAVAQDGDAQAQQGGPEVYELPGENVFPEGIALSPDGSSFYVGSTTTGTIYEGDIASGEVRTLAEGLVPTAIGMEVDEHGRLWVAGGMTGSVFVFDTESGELLRTYDTPQAEATFLNDLTVHEGSVYVTDSARPVLFRIGAGEQLGEGVEEFVGFSGTAFPYDQPFNANGIAVSPDGSGLVIVHSGNGNLYRVDLESKEVTQVQNSGEPSVNGDGLFLDGDTLYVVRNADEQVDRYTVSPSGDAVEPAGEPITSDEFQYPATAVVADGYLLATNTQFDQQGEGGQPVVPFTIARVEIPQADGAQGDGAQDGQSEGQQDGQDAQEDGEQDQQN